jgi:hypothetical protein
MTISRLEISNYLGIDEFTLDDVGDMVLITGDNRTGKTTILKAVREAFESSGAHVKLLHDPNHPARIVLELDTNDDKHVEINRRITGAANTVAVKVDGATLNAPQRYLNTLIGGHPFNPVEFFLESPDERRRLLLQALDIKLTPAQLLKLVAVPTVAEQCIEETINWKQHGLGVLRDVRARVYDLRADKNRELTQLRKAIEQDRADMPTVVKPERFKGFDLKKAMREVEQAATVTEEHQSNLDRYAEYDGTIKGIKRDIADLEERLRRKRAELETESTARDELKVVIDSFEPPDVSDTKKMIADYEKFTKHRQALENIRQRTKRADALEKAHKELDEFHVALGSTVPQELLRKAKMPVANVTIDDDGIKVGGVDLTTLSTSEQLEFAVQIARSLATELRFILIDRFESLGTDARKRFVETARGDGFQYLMTQVTRGQLKVSGV